MASRISPSGKPVSSAPCGGSGRPSEPDQHQDDRLDDADHAEDQQLGRQVGARGQARRAFPDVDRAFLDQLPDRAGGAGQAGADDEQQQGLAGVRVGAGRAGQALLRADQADQHAEDDRQQPHGQQVAAVGGEHPDVPAGQRGHLPRRAAPRDHRFGHVLRARPRPPAWSAGPARTARRPATRRTRRPSRGPGSARRPGTRRPSGPCRSRRAPRRAARSRRSGRRGPGPAAGRRCPGSRRCA